VFNVNPFGNGGIITRPSRMNNPSEDFDTPEDATGLDIPF
jgi:hypothetical protein